MRTDSLLLSLGILPNKAAFGYIKAALKINTECSLMNQVYDSVAKLYSTTSHIVYDAIRRAISFADSCGKLKNIDGYFGVKVYDENHPMTNSEFLSLLKIIPDEKLIA